MGLLSRADVLKLHAAVVSAKLADSRAALLARIDPTFVARLPDAPIPGDQLMLDLDTMNDAGTLTDDSVPLAIWLENAIAHAGGRVEALTFQAALDQCPGPRPAAKAAPSPPTAPDQGGHRAPPAGEAHDARSHAPPPPAWIVPAGFVLGVAGVIALLVIATRTPDPSRFQYDISLVVPVPSTVTATSAPPVSSAVVLAPPPPPIVDAGTTVSLPPGRPRPVPTASATAGKDGGPAPGPASPCAPGTTEMEFHKADSARCGEPTATAYMDQSKLRWTREVGDDDGGTVRQSCFCTKATP